MMTQAPKRKLWLEAEAAKAVALGSKWLRTRQAAAYLNIGYRTLEKLRSSGGGPPYRKVTGTVLYRMDELDQWVDSRTYTSTSDEMSKEASRDTSS